MKRIRLIQICIGVGSGNIGDELMAQEFWKLLPANVVLDVQTLPEANRYRGIYPAPHRFPVVGSRSMQLPDAPGLLVGGTPVAEFEGLEFPLRTVGAAISAIVRRGFPVDAISVGVDRLHTPEARELFARHYAGIRSWTVRTEACREALLDLGVPEQRIRVAADLAWLFEPSTETDAWAAELWNRLGIQSDRPLLAVNVVHHADPSNVAPKRVIAEALDRLARESGYQIAFLHNECRTSFDAAAAAAVRALMQEPSVEVPAAYYTPQEMVSLLRRASTVLSQRFHMAIQAILAGTIPVCLLRGQKLSGLAREFDLLSAPIESGPIVESVRESAARRQDRLAALAEKREQHRIRAGGALSFFGEYLAQGGAKRPRRAAIQQIAVIHLGGLGDLVLASSLLMGLRRKYAKASIHLLCRAPFAGLAELFPSAPDQVIPIGFDPNAYSQLAPAVQDALRQLDEQLSELRPDIVLSAELEPTWLSWYLASRWQAPENLACTRMEAPRGLLPILLHEAALEPVAFRGPTWHAEMVEGDRYALLARAVGIEQCPAPRWALTREQDRETTAFLRDNGLAAGTYAVCFPLGATSTLVKRWPATSFASALELATEHFSWPVLLTGEAHERTALESHATELRQRGATVAVFAGTVAEVGLLAGLLAKAKFFLGNDTGPAHIAQAYGTPGAVIFGGGTWPHYRPWGPGAVGVVHPLACFGCRWDCAFGQPICIEGVTVDSVVRALEQAKANPTGAAAVVATATASQELQTITGSAARHYRAVQDDRLARYRALVETEYARTVAEERIAGLADELVRKETERRETLLSIDTQLAHVDSRMAAGAAAAGSATQSALIWRDAAEERLAKLEELSREYSLITTEATNRAQALDELDRLFRETEARRAQAQLAADLRLELIESISRELTALQGENAARLSTIENADGLLRRQEAEIQELRAGYAARLVAIEEANALLQNQQREIGELREGHAARLVAIEEANALLEKQQREIGELREGHAARLVAIEEANVLLEKQQREIEELREGYAARLVAIEEANALLEKQQREIGELREGHAARLVAIEEANVLLEKQQREIGELREGHAARLVAIEEANTLLERQQREIGELREGHAARLVAIEEANTLLERQQQEIGELREGHAARLVAIEEANVLLRAQEDELGGLRAEVNALQTAKAQAAVRIQELDVAATERLAALQHANLLLAASHAAYAEQGHRLSVFESAAAERLAALEATTASLRAETMRRSQLAADLETVAAAQAEARRRQAEEREHWQGTLAELRTELNQERVNRLNGEEQLTLLRADLEQVRADRDRYRRSTEELALSEQDLRRQILAAESETLLQSVFRRTTVKSH
jgi:ADP-heptose:LPS heptosyltransferase/polysaccharide pyruvyl transferase WcaK-like protein